MNIREALARTAETPPKKQRNVQPRAHCPSCGKKGLGNLYHGKPLNDAGPARPYKQCRFCNHFAEQNA